MPKKNEFTEVLEEMAAELREGRHDADKANPIPFGLERLTKRKYEADRLRNGTAAERSQFLATHGMEAMLKLLRGNNDTA